MPPATYLLWELSARCGWTPATIRALPPPDLAFCLHMLALEHAVRRKP